MKNTDYLKNLPSYLLKPLPLPLIQPLLARAIRRAAQHQPGIFERLGEHGKKTFIIDPVNFPFVFVLRPDVAVPVLKAVRRNRIIEHDAAISGTFLTLLRMIGGRLDGDALFFSRTISVSGDIEAAVVLRNALDDVDGSLVSDLLPSFAKRPHAAFQRIKRR